jgi:hypothetical protein
MEVKLKDRLPSPRTGMWDLEVEEHPKCPGATKSDVGGGYTFIILYADKQWCGVEPVSWFTPSWVSYAEVTLILKDTNGTKIADSVSCVYNTRFDTSLLTFKGEITSENLRYGGSLEEEGTDVESMVNSGVAVRMDFYDAEGKNMQQRHVKLGDPIVFRIDVAESNIVNKVLPETCYFSSSSVPEENPPFGQTLTFVRKNCFNDKNGMVKAFLPKMDRSINGTVYDLAFPAFHFTDFGRNLFVHCTILACIGNQMLCEPKPNCFGTSRRKRDTSDSDMRYNGRLRETKDTEEPTKEFVMTKYIIVEDKRKDALTAPSNHPNMVRSLDSYFGSNTLCMQTGHFAALTGTVVSCLLMLLVAVSYLAGRMLCRPKPAPQWVNHDKSFAVYSNPSTMYSTSVKDLQHIGSF